MILSCRGRSALRKDGCDAAPSRGAGPRNWSSNMKWETPQATDFRFGMEITMYIANR